MICHPPCPSPCRRPAELRAFDSITQRHLAQLAGLLRPTQNTLFLEGHLDYKGYLSILITARDPNRPTLVISGTRRDFQLSEAREDSLAQLGTFASIEALAKKIAQRWLI